MSITEPDHIVIVVADIEEGIRNWRDGLGLSLSHTVNQAEAGIRQAFIHPKSANGVMIQLWPKNRAHRWRASTDGEGERRQTRSSQ